MRITAAAYAPPPQPVRAAARPVGAAGVAAPGPLATAPARVAAVVRQLEAEAGTLDRAGRVSDTARGVLDGVETIHRDADDADAGRAAGHALTRGARFEDRPLFDGRYSIHVGGGRLDLPDFTTAPPTPEAVGSLRDTLVGFKRDVIDRRLGIVRQAIHHAVDAAAVFLHDPTRPTGRLLDVTG